MNVKIYACFLPGSATPDYIGSHLTEPGKRSAAAAWRYAHCVYLGCGCWLYPDGRLDAPRLNREHSPWTARLLALTPAELAAIRVETLVEVDSGRRWEAERAAIRTHKPPFNAIAGQSAEQRKAKWNAYCRGYLKRYYAERPEKAAAKREADKLRIRAKRAALKQSVA